LQAVAGSPLSLPPAPIGMAPEPQLPVFELQHRPSVHASPGLHLFFGWHMHPSDPGIQSVMSTEPEAPLGITHFPDLQTPLAQSGPVLQVVFGSSTLGMQSPPVHTPLWQSLASVQDEPAGEPGITELVSSPPEPSPPELEPAVDVELSPPGVDVPEPPAEELPL
jgi:hypothetical protein